MPSDLRFGAVADDFTGGSDLAGMLHERGVRTVLSFGAAERADVPLWSNYQAAVVCLKTRSIEPADAVRQSVHAAETLRDAGARQIQFKYCSTFDSTSRGNIGPVIEALLKLLGSRFTIAVPALPVNGRTQYMGHLFVHGELLSESPMRHHPLNPMTESNLVRHLQTQTSLRVGLIDLQTVRRGIAAIAERRRELESSGVSIALVDAVCDEDLDAIAQAALEMPLITGGSGLPACLPVHWHLPRARRAEKTSPVPGPVLILSGSCSAATLAQLRHLQSSGAATLHGIDFGALLSDPSAEQDRLAALAAQILRRGASVCIYSSADAETRSAASARLRMAGFDATGLSEALESCFGAIARRLLREGATHKLIVAGGETAGAVAGAVGVRALEVTSVLDPGVPALKTLHGTPVKLALKSGNFGSEDFFARTIHRWETEQS